MVKVLNRRNHGVPDNAVFIGRPSKYGNPFEIGRDGDRDEVITKFKNYLLSNPVLLNDAKRELKGKDLVCFCSPKPCHGGVLLKMVNTMNMTKDNYIYDEETYPNVFLYGAIHEATDTVYIFEISDRRDDRAALYAYTEFLRENNGCEVGFNNYNYDYPVKHAILKNINTINNAEIFRKSDSIINCDPNNRFAHVIWDRDQIVPQLDLLKIHHFDNKARMTGLKALEFAMRMDNIEDLPFPPGTILTHEQIDTLRSYLGNDLRATLNFKKKSQDQINLRIELSEKYDRNFMNHNDTKIGKDYFIMELEKAGVKCFDSNRQPIQTPRASIALKDVIFPYINFEHSEFNRILNWLKSQVITETKGVFEGLTCNVHGFEFVFGTGGIHGSVESQTIRSTDNYVIIDKDVTSFYPKLAIVNKLFPEHLSALFCIIYENVFNMRLGYEKGTAENAVFKLALNGVYGDSNNPYSPFFDPNYTMGVTINGQLLLCVLAEQLMKVPGLKMIQANTDGLTIYVPRAFTSMVNQICAWWEKFTCLTLEEAIYDSMHIRDVNNYIAVYEDGKKVKRKGAYGHSKDLGWHQNHSSQVVAKAAEAALVHGKDIREFIMNHKDFYDFMIMIKVPRSSKLMIGERQIQNTSRVYISVDGEALFKHMPPLPKQLAVNPAAPFRKIAQCKGWLATECNDIKRANRATVNYEYYIKEAKKLVEPLK